MSNSFFKYKNVEWSLPLLFQNEPILGAIFYALKVAGYEMPKTNVFGCPSSKWTGGREPIIIENISENIIKNVFKYVKNLNATPTFTFSSTQLTKEDLKDSYANFLLDIALENNARFIVYSDMLKDYIKEKKPDACVVASVIKSNCRFQGADRIEDPTVENETKYYNKLLKEYDVVVVRPEYSKTVLVEHPEYIDDISRIEVMINHTCIANCPKMPEHYRYSESCNYKKEQSKGFECIKTTLRLKDILKLNLSHSTEITEKLVQNGVKKLKLQGRGFYWSTEDLLYMLYGQMFNTDGEFYHIQSGIISRFLHNEGRHFASILNNCT